MLLSSSGLARIRIFESFRPTAYKDAAGIWTAGYGHIKGVTETTTCAMAEALDWLMQDVAEAVDCVNKSVTVTLNQNQFDALVSFTFNEGSGNFRCSTMLDLLNQGSYTLAAMQLDRWVYVKKRKTQGLIDRRAAERKLFETAV